MTPDMQRDDEYDVRDSIVTLDNVKPEISESFTRFNGRITSPSFFFETPVEKLHKLDILSLRITPLSFQITEDLGMDLESEAALKANPHALKHLKMVVQDDVDSISNSIATPQTKTLSLQYWLKLGDELVTRNQTVRLGLVNPKCAVAEFCTYELTGSWRDWELFVKQVSVSLLALIGIWVQNGETRIFFESLEFLQAFNRFEFWFTNHYHC